MGKVAKPKKRDISVHSRAARRGASPVPVVPVKAATEETEYKPWLHSAQDAGIAKKKKVKQLSRQQKARQQRGMEKAEQDMDKHEKKVADSKSRGRAVDARRADWDALNGALSGKKATMATKFDILNGDTKETTERDDDANAMDDGNDAVLPSTVVGTAAPVAADNAERSEVAQDVDEVL